ncbi:hypothetical protein CPB84DRAFT_1745520 [Gymnopilus junonius]|uniref:Uncharacterized protein n=1 Tax=Gymnopilus junonius TaxID=109634 RepID=A0A9P5NQ54_GYMJU|nr:hypothetical protein CPB84DRAFT_1745520 [Gymnopilus junonius]
MFRHRRAPSLSGRSRYPEGVPSASCVKAEDSALKCQGSEAENECAFNLDNLRSHNMRNLQLVQFTQVEVTPVRCMETDTGHKRMRAWRVGALSDWTWSPIGWIPGLWKRVVRVVIQRVLAGIRSGVSFIVDVNNHKVFDLEAMPWVRSCKNSYFYIAIRQQEFGVGLRDEEESKHEEKRAAEHAWKLDSKTTHAEDTSQPDDRCLIARRVVNCGHAPLQQVPRWLAVVVNDDEGGPSLCIMDQWMLASGSAEVMEMEEGGDASESFFNFGTFEIR